MQPCGQARLIGGAKHGLSKVLVTVYQMQKHGLSNVETFSKTMI
jgi:hypothetical protein